MKKILFIMSICALGCVPACSHQKSKHISKVENLPSSDAVYSVEGDTVPYTFIDAKGKYDVGNVIQ